MIASAYTLHNIVKDASSLNVQQVTECLRSLRNACATSSNVQTSLQHETSVLRDVCSALNTVLSFHRTEEHVLCLRIGVQFLGNFIVNNIENQKEVWSQCSSLLRYNKSVNNAISNVYLIVKLMILSFLWNKKYLWLILWIRDSFDVVFFSIYFLFILLTVVYIKFKILYSLNPLEQNHPWQGRP